jgi:hypothetical protein
MLTSENLITISTTLIGNEIADKRKQNLTYEMSKYGIPVLFSIGDKYEKGKTNMNEIMYNATIKRFELFLETNYEYGIICDDDFHPISNFLDELKITVKLLPENWRCLHLCPGALWGRRLHLCENVYTNIIEGLLYTDGNISELAYHPCGRFFIEDGFKRFSGQCIWLGGPVAFLIRRERVKELMDEFIELFKKEWNPNDVILSQIMSKDDYVCRTPQMGYEKQFGNSCFS